MENIYLPDLAVVDKITDETSDIKTFTLSFASRTLKHSFSFKPGQFVEASIFGAGEAPFGFASNPNRPQQFDITVRAIGAVTRAMHQLTPGAYLGIRGPLGNCFPLEEVKGQDILFVAGGIGLPPLKSLIEPMLDCRKEFGQFFILYGARTPADRVYKPLLQAWSERQDITFLQTVDTPDPGWNGPVGVVTTLFEKIHLDVNRTVAFTCGPPVMIRFVIQELLAKGFAEDRIISTLERYMKCGVGKCGHCAIGHKYICVDGPVFSWRQIKRLPER
ncbi:MAG TPA: FAD/NAD(P)-binding protein [bacterium]|nr:FAD/NAD(P)-binding protein [bacterium]HQI49738.1 FAD/NAD(P)-binding protein [bacterium]HQJ65870.1 FAD/NAD(P)-binding protein [bacterium]